MPVLSPCLKCPNISYIFSEITVVMGVQSLVVLIAIWIDKKYEFLYNDTRFNRHGHSRSDFTFLEQSPKAELRSNFNLVPK